VSPALSTGPTHTHRRPDAAPVLPRSAREWATATRRGGADQGSFRLPWRLPLFEASLLFAMRSRRSRPLIGLLGANPATPSTPPTSVAAATRLLLSRTAGRPEIAT
jgi:hypothetical protein